MAALQWMWFLQKSQDGALRVSKHAREKHGPPSARPSSVSHAPEDVAVFTGHARRLVRELRETLACIEDMDAGEHAALVNEIASMWKGQGK